MMSLQAGQPVVVEVVIIHGAAADSITAATPPPSAVSLFLLLLLLLQIGRKRGRPLKLHKTRSEIAIEQLGGSLAPLSGPSSICTATSTTTTPLKEDEGDRCRCCGSDGPIVMLPTTATVFNTTVEISAKVFSQIKKEGKISDTMALVYMYVVAVGVVVVLMSLLLRVFRSCLILLFSRINCFPMPFTAPRIATTKAQQLLLLLLQL